MLRPELDGAGGGGVGDFFPPGSQEAREAEITRRAAWLGGFFQVDGSIGFRIKQQVVSGREYTYAYPIVQLQDERKERLEVMKRLLGGNLYQLMIRGEERWRWVITKSDDVVRLMNVMKGFSPLYEEVILAVGNFENSSIDERITIAQEMKGYDRFLEVQPDDYSHLVPLEEFVAGVVDGKGRFTRPRGLVRTMMQVNTRNRALLESLRGQWGGSVFVQHEEGSEVVIRGYPFVTKHATYRWDVGVENLQVLLRAIRPHLVLLKDECEQILAMR